MVLRSFCDVLSVADSERVSGQLPFFDILKHIFF